MTAARALLLICALGALGGCRRGADADGDSSRGLKVEAYDAPIPKAPLTGRLDTLPPQPIAASSAPAASGLPASDAPPT